MFVYLCAYCFAVLNYICDCLTFLFFTIVLSITSLNFSANYPYLHCLLWQFLAGAASSPFVGFLPFWVEFCWSRGLSLLYFCAPLSFFECLCAFGVFVTNLIMSLLFNFCLRLVYLCPYFAVSFGHLVSFLGFHWFHVLFKSIVFLNSPLLLSCMVLAHHNPLCQHGVLFSLTILCETCPDRPFRTLFSRFFVPSVALYSIALIPINYYPFTLIIYHFAQKSQNIMSGEISPAIVPKLWPIWPWIPPSCLVFVLFNISCITNHSSTPVYSHFNIRLPVYTRTFHTYVCNLIKK